MSRKNGGISLLFFLSVPTIVVRAASNSSASGIDVKKLSAVIFLHVFRISCDKCFTTADAVLSYLYVASPAKFLSYLYKNSLNHTKHILLYHT